MFFDLSHHQAKVTEGEIKVIRYLHMENIKF